MFSVSAPLSHKCSVPCYCDLLSALRPPCFLHKGLTDSVPSVCKTCPTHLYALELRTSVMKRAILSSGFSASKFLRRFLPLRLAPFTEST